MRPVTNKKSEKDRRTEKVSKWLKTVDARSLGNARKPSLLAKCKYCGNVIGLKTEVGRCRTCDDCKKTPDFKVVA